MNLGRRPGIRRAEGGQSSGGAPFQAGYRGVPDARNTRQFDDNGGQVDSTMLTTHMRTFVLRARAAPTDSRKLLAAVGHEAHTEILAHTLMNAIFVAQSHRPGVTVYLVLESAPDFSRTIRFEADAMHDIGGFHEQALLGKIAAALDASVGMGKDETRDVETGVTVRTVSFERLVQELAEDHQLLVMDPKGKPIGEQGFGANPCFLLTDHIPMPPKTFHTLDRLGAIKLTLGPTMLFASQCAVLIHHELDGRSRIVDE